MSTPKDAQVEKGLFSPKPNSALYPGGLDVRRAFDHIEEMVNRGAPFSRWEYVPVTFPSTANIDVIVRHSLNPTDPESVVFQVLNPAHLTAPAAATYVYKDSSATRKPWQGGYIVVRSTGTSYSCILLVALPRIVSNAAQTNL